MPTELMKMSFLTPGPLLAPVMTTTFPSMLSLMTFSCLLLSPLSARPAPSGARGSGPREEAFAERAEGHEADPEFLARGQHVLLGLSPEERVFALERRDGLHRVGAPDRLDARLGEAEVLDLPLPDQFLDRAGHVLDGHFGVDAVLVVEVDGLDPEPLERTLGHLPDVLRPAVEHLLPRGRVEVEAELGGDHHLSAE